MDKPIDHCFKVWTPYCQAEPIPVYTHRQITSKLVKEGKKLTLNMAYISSHLHHPTSVSVDIWWHASLADLIKHTHQKVFLCNTITRSMVNEL